MVPLTTSENPQWMDTIPLGDSGSLFKNLGAKQASERRRSKRVPQSIGILVQPLDQYLAELSEPFFAITRDPSQGGLSFLSPQHSSFGFALISPADQGQGEVVCRICNSAIVHETQNEHVYLTNVEYLYEKYL